MTLSKHQVNSVYLQECLCNSVLQWLRSHCDEFKQIDKQEEPPLRTLDHGLYGEYTEVEDQDTVPYPYMVRGTDNKYYHGYRFDAQVAHQVVHQTEGLDGVMGPNDEEAEAYFRVVLGYASGKEHLRVEKELLERLHSTLIPAVLAVFGEQNNPEAFKCSRLYSVYALLQLPGHSVNLHLDVPEFLGVDRSTCPNWLLVAAHASGLFKSQRVKNVTAVCYPATASGGALAVYGPKSKVYPVTAGTGVVLDADSCFHHSEQCRPSTETSEKQSPPKQAVPVPYLPNGCILHVEEKEEQIWWHLKTPEGNLVSSHKEEDLRFSLSCKFHVFHDQEELERFESNKEALTAEEIIDILVEDLRKNKKLPDDSSRVPLYQLGPLLVNEYILPLAPTVSEIQDLWEQFYIQ